MRLSDILAAATLLAATILIPAASVPAQAGPTLDGVRERGVLACGVEAHQPGFSEETDLGLKGFDVDFCKVLAAAIFGDETKVRFVPVSDVQRFPELRSGGVDVLLHTVTATLSRDAAQEVNFGPVIYYEGQSFMVPRKFRIDSARKLDGASICIPAGTTSELNLLDYFRIHKMRFVPVVMERPDKLAEAYFAGRCTVFTSDSFRLLAARAERAADPRDHVILPEIIAKEPLAPAIRAGDEEFADIVRWSVFATIEAEERGVTSGNIDRMLATEDPALRRFLGATPGLGKALGLHDRWAFDIVRRVGNYGEIFERNLGQGSRFKAARGVNDLWSRGGLLYAQPFR